MKIRATNPHIQESLKILGASPVGIPVPEVYNALERGVVDEPQCLRGTVGF